MSETPTVTTDKVEAASIDDDDQDLRTLLKQFITVSNVDRLKSQQDIAEMRVSIQKILRGSPQKQDDDLAQTPFPDRRKPTRRTSMFFGSPGFEKADAAVRSQIQVLQADIIYDKELKISSLEGLQYLAKQKAMLSSRYPERELKIAHMVSINLRPYVIAAWNSHCYKESLITGREPEELMVEDWLSLNNEAVDAILLESARPRTRELYSRELVIFLGKGIPQTPDINTENFNKIFYVPLMKSLNDLINLHDLLGEETTNHSNNKSKMPSELYGTKDSPGHVALWIISLGHQKDAVLQWLGKDELLKHKTVALAVKYIRSKLMEARSQSEARQDLDAKLTPIKYEEIRHTQAESYQRHQVNVSTRTPYRIPDHRLSDARSKSSFSALQMSHSQDELAFQAPHDPDDFIQENITDNVSYEQNDEDHYIGSSDTHSPQDNPPMDVNPLNAVADVNSFRSAIASTFRGYCCEYFVFGTCPKRYSGCSYDHSAAGQEMCIQSFVLLSKRELSLHSQLPPYATNNAGSTTTRPPSKFSSQNSQNYIQPRTYGKPGPPSTYSNPSNGPSILRNYNKFGTKGSSLTAMHTNNTLPDDPLIQITTDPSTVFDPDHVLSHTLLTQLASATSVTSRELCQPFLRHGHILTATSADPIYFDRLLLDTGAQGSNFISAQAFSMIPVTHHQSVRDIDKVVRLGDTRHLSVQLEVLLNTSIADSTGQVHTHHLWYSVLPSLSHDLIIGLVDLIGPYYDLFNDAVQHSRHLSNTRDLDDPFSNTNTSLLHVNSISEHKKVYNDRKKLICQSPSTSINQLALQDGSATTVLSHHTLGSVYADNRVELRYDLLTSITAMPTPGQIIPPWSKPIDTIAPEELNTPDPTSFPDDILAYLTTTPDETKSAYHSDLETHVTPEMQQQLPEIMTLLKSQLAYDVFIPTVWTGICMEPYHLDVKPGLPEYMKAHTRPVRAALYLDAKKEFDRMKTYFYEKSTSPIACPLVVAPKATTPFIRLCGDYRPINAFITIPQEPIPHVQQSLAKAAGWKIFIDLDMTNSFHQIPIDDFSSNLLSVSTPWGLFRPKFLPEGVGPASGILQSIVRRIFEDFDDWTIVIFDNFLILASDYTDAFNKLTIILQRCKDHGLVLKMKKSWIGTTLVTFFGYEVQPGSWQLSQSRKDAISSLLFPSTQKQMQSFLGAANFFHTHIPNYANWASALYECTTTTFNWNPNTWTKDYPALFKIFQDAIQNSVTLHFPDYALPWILRVDASDYAVGAVLFQEFTTIDNTIIHQPIAFISHKFSGAAMNWDTFKQEAYALYYGVSQLSYYLRGKEFVLETDHRNLLWIESSHVPIVVRWRVLLQSYTFTVKHIPGKDNNVADWLSRMYPLPSPELLVPLTSTLSLTEMFNSIHGGRNLHYGAKRTYLALCKQYPGHSIPLRVIQDLVAECPTCQKDRVPLQLIPHNNVRETLMHHKRTIGMDHVTVTPPDEDGYIGLLLIVELDTKFPQAYPVRDYSATTVATILFKHFCTFGSYDAIISDPGSAFTSTIIKQLNEWLGITHHVSLIGRHESNGTEHVNCLFVGHLRRLVHDERLTRRWASDTVLPLINHALSTSPNSELGGLSPAELKFGTIDLHKFQLPPPLLPGSDYAALINQLNNNLAIIRSATNDYQTRLRIQRTATEFKQNTFQPGDLILWNPRETATSLRSAKLSPKLLGPYTVIQQTKNNVKCQHIITSQEMIFHADRITPFVGTNIEASQAGLLDREEYVIHHISAHRGTFKRKQHLEFLVHWDGYTSDSDSWEPWSELRDTQPLHRYLQEIGQSGQIPQNHV